MHHHCLIIPKSERAAHELTGVVNLHQRFYIEHRMANWGNAHFRGASHPSVPGLLDFRLARLLHRRPDMGDELPYEIVTRFAPELCAHPFSNDVWSGPTRARAEADGTLRPPLEAATEQSFPWQFALFRASRDRLIEEALAHASLWQGIVAPERHRALLDTPVEPFGSAEAKMLFGLVTATDALRGDVRAEREFSGLAQPLRAGGSLAGRAARWFAHRSIEPGLDGWAAAALRGDAPEALGHSADFDAAALARAPSVGADGAASEVARLRGENAALRDRLAAARQELEHLIRQTERARADAKVIEESRSWRLMRAAIRIPAAIRRRPAEPVTRLERLAKR